MEKWGESSLSFADKQLYEHWKIMNLYFLQISVLSLIDFLSNQKALHEDFFHDL